MKSFFLSMFFLLFANLAIAQNNFNQTLQKKDVPFFQTQTSGWFKMNPDVQLSTEELLLNYHTALGLSDWDELKNYRSETDKLGITHHRFQQYHRSIPVEGGIFLVHEKTGAVLTFNGEWASGINLQSTPSFSKEQAIEKALVELPAEKYIWEDAGAVAMLRKIKKSEAASFYPQPELVWLNPQFNLKTQNFRLAYKMEVQAELPLFRQQVYLDAVSGEIIQSIDLLHDTNVPATAETKYSGTQQMVTDSVGPGVYRLRETGRGNGIETYDMNGGVVYGDAVDFLDTDNFWNNINTEIDEAATDAHWGAEMTFDYMLTQHDFTGVDNNGMALINYVHFDSLYFNAFWNGSWASFGDGNGSSAQPLTSLDVVAHEFAHGITENTANLIYLNESGALNESFSDIIGAAVEFWATPDQADWYMGEDFLPSANGFRDMSSPNARSHPDTYLGFFWFTGTEDNGGVHTNSGVQNFWWHLLADGGNGTTDNGRSYSVESIGVDTATAIAMRNLRYYLTNTSDYADAKAGSLQAAEDLYGPCSHYYIQTSQAWEGVGLGDGIEENDVLVSDLIYPTPVACGLTDTEFPEIQIKYIGCNSSLDASSEIPIAFQLDNGSIVHDTIVLVANFVGGEFLSHQSTQSISGLEEMGTHTLRVWTTFDEDPNSSNDTMEFVIQNVFEQNVDFGMETVATPGSNCFMTNENVQVELGFFGCDSIAAGTELNVFYILNEGDTIMENLVLPQTIYAFETYEYTFSTPLDFTNELGANNLQSGVVFTPDFIDANNVLEAKLVTNPKLMIEEDVLTFEGGVASLDSIYTLANRASDVFMASNAAASGAMGIQMTGGDLFNLLGEVVTPDEMNVWLVNDLFSAQTCFCVDASLMNEVELSFDLQQTYSPIYLQVFGIDPPIASSLRVLANNQQISQTINPTTNQSDPIVNHVFDLSTLGGTSFEVCLETRNLLNPSFDSFGVGDNAFIDNIRIGGLMVAAPSLVKELNTLTIIPNPVSSRLHIALENKWRGKFQLQIINALGQVVQTTSLEKSEASNSFEMDVENLSTGIYRLSVSNGMEMVVQTFVKI